MATHLVYGNPSHKSPGHLQRQGYTHFVSHTHTHARTHAHTHTCTPPTHTHTLLKGKEAPSGLKPEFVCLPLSKRLKLHPHWTSSPVLMRKPEVRSRPVASQSSTALSCIEKNSPVLQPLFYIMRKQPTPATTLLYTEKNSPVLQPFCQVLKKQPSPSTILSGTEKQPSPSTILSCFEKQTAWFFNHFVIYWKNSLVLQPLCHILKKTAQQIWTTLSYIKKHSTSLSHQQQNVLLTLCILAWPPRRAGVWAALPHWWPENSPAASHQRQELVPGRHRVRLCQRLIRQVHRRQVQGG